MNKVSATVIKTTLIIEGEDEIDATAFQNWENKISEVLSFLKREKKVISRINF